MAAPSLMLSLCALVRMHVCASVRKKRVRRLVCVCVCEREESVCVCLCASFPSPQSPGRILSYGLLASPFVIHIQRVIAIEFVYQDLGARCQRLVFTLEKNTVENGGKRRDSESTTKVAGGY